MLNYSQIENFEERVIPTRLYRYQVALEITGQNLPVLNELLGYFQQRLRQKIDLQSLRLEKVFVSEGEPSELLIFFSVNPSEKESIWLLWKRIENELVPVGTGKLISAYAQAPQLVELGQPEAGILQQIKSFLDSYGILVELILLVIIIAILLSEKKQ